MIDINKFIEVAVEKKNELLEGLELNDRELHCFLAGMNSAIFALKEVEKNQNVPENNSDECI